MIPQKPATITGVENWVDTLERKESLSLVRYLRSGRVVVGILLAFGVFGVGCIDWMAGRGGTAQNIVLVTLDTARADHLGAYGYGLNTSPEFDAFARRATLYARAHSSAPWTLPSHASLFTGLDPFEHGAISYYETDHPRNAYPLAREHLTFAEILSDEGFVTGAFVANDGFLGRDQQLDQGFQTYVVNRVPGVELNQEVFSWLEENASNRFFLFVNYMDSHRPYNTSPLPGRDLPSPDPDITLMRQLKQTVLPGARDAPEDLVERLKSRYDMGIAHADRALGLLLDRIASLGLDGSTAIVVTSDHGEFLGEHRLAEHSKDVYQEGIRVPLAIRHAGQSAAAASDVAVSSADLPRLMAKCLREPWGSRVIERLPRRSPGSPVLSENYFARTGALRNPEWSPRFSRIRRSLIDWPLKYIESSDGRHELFDLSADPGERMSRIEEMPDASRRLSRLLAERLDQPRRQLAPRPEQQHGRDGETLSESELESLRALGYLDE